MKVIDITDHGVPGLSSRLEQALVEVIEREEFSDVTLSTLVGTLEILKQGYLALLRQ